MKLKVKKMDWSSGNSLICILNTEDAARLNAHRGERILIRGIRNHKKITATLDESLYEIKEGEIGLNYEASKLLDAIDGMYCEIEPVAISEAVRYIKDKLDGKRLSKDQINKIVEGITNNNLSSIELTYFVAGSYIRGLSLQETSYLTEAMYKTGDVLKFDSELVVDKHCIGGVAGNRTTPIVVSIVAAAGLTIPKTSSRSITSPAGTADAMEVIFNVELKEDDIFRVVKKTGGCMIWGGALSLAPADDKIIRIEHPMAIDSFEQMVASVLAKKKSVSSDIVLIDIPVGRYAKIKSMKEGLRLAELFRGVSKRIGLRTEVIITKANGPIGRGIGPALEARDILRIFENHPLAPVDLKKKGIMLSGKLLELAGKANKGTGNKMAEEIMNSGMARDKFFEIGRAQGLRVDSSSKVSLGQYKTFIRANKSGVVSLIRNDLIAYAARIAGAPKDKGAGIYLKALRGEKVEKNQILFELYAENMKKLNEATKYINQNNPYLIKQ